MITFKRGTEIYAAASELHELYYVLDNENDIKIKNFIKNNVEMTNREITETLKEHYDFCVFLRGFSNMSDRYDNANVKFYKKYLRILNILMACDIIQIKRED